MSGSLSYYIILSATEIKATLHAYSLVGVPTLPPDSDSTLTDDTTRGQDISDSTPVGVIAGAVIGAVVGIIALVVAIVTAIVVAVVICRRRKVLDKIDSYPRPVMYK